MNECICCSRTLLKHWKHNSISWYCLTCRQEMPNLKTANSIHHYRKQNTKNLYQLSPKKLKISCL